MGISNGWDMLPEWAKWLVIVLVILGLFWAAFKPAIEVWKLLAPKMPTVPVESSPPSPPPSMAEAEDTTQPEKVRLYLIRRARARASVSYSEAALVVARRPDLSFYREVLDVVSVQEVAATRPNLTAIVYNANGPPGRGFFRHHEFFDVNAPGAISFWQEEKERVYAFWADLSFLREYQWELIYDPTEYNRTAKKQGSKRMRFGAAGAILDGSNSNENTWRAAQGILEFVTGDGTSLSRFEPQPDALSFIQTSDHLAILPVGQRLIRRSKLE